MKILFVARFDSGDNDDEGAIAHALRQLGHTVVQVHEHRQSRTAPLESYDADWCLFLKWPSVGEIAKTAERMPTAYWHFDMIRSVVDDPTLRARSEHRLRWCRNVLPHVVLGFHTDGDYVGQDTSGKLRHLMQGMDERTVGPGKPLDDGSVPEILFTGMVNHGRRRAEHVAHLRQRYGDRFGVLGDGGPRRRKHGRALADVFATAKIVVAPDGPNTDLYCSNRVFLTTGLGGFLLHPRCKSLERHYESWTDLNYYNDPSHLDQFIEWYLSDDAAREAMRLQGYNACLRSNLYRHRCEDLVGMVQEAIG